MTTMLELQPEIEKGRLAQAEARGMSIDDFVKEIVVGEAHFFTEGMPKILRNVRLSAPKSRRSRGPLRHWLELSSGEAIKLR